MLRWLRKFGSPASASPRGRRFVALLTTLCLVVATATAQAQATKPAFKLTIKPTVTTFTTAKFVVTTSVATRLTIATGTDRNNLVPTPDRLKTGHVVSVRGLAPNTNYYALITATPKTGKAAKAWRTFKTAAPGSAPATVTSRGNKILLNGQPFFPIMVEGLTCPDQPTISSNGSMGVDIFDNGAMRGCLENQDSLQSIPELHAMFGGKMWLSDRNASDAQLLQGLPELLNWTTNIAFLAAYNYVGGCGDYIPPSGSTAAGGIFTSIQRASHSGPIGYYTDVTNLVGPGKRFCLVAADLKVIFWTVVAAGGSGIKYNTQLPWDPSTGVSVNSDVQVAAAQVAAWMGTLGPAILSGKSVQIKSDPKSTVKLAGWQYGGHTYLVAVNTDSKATRATFSVPGLTATTTAKVMWESRAVKFNNSTISDSFAPLAVHIYQVAPATAT